MRYCTINVAKTKVLISCAVTAQLIGTFVFAHVNFRFSHDVAHIAWYYELTRESLYEPGCSVLWLGESGPMGYYLTWKFLS